MSSDGYVTRGVELFPRNLALYLAGQPMVNEAGSMSSS